MMRPETSPDCSCLHCSGLRREAEEPKPPYGKSISLMVASFCMNCNQIVDRLDTCPVCGSHSLLSLARVLNRSAA